MLRLLVQIPAGFILLVWPMAVMMSPMVFDAPGSTSNKSMLVPLVIIVFYPTLIGAAFYSLNWSFLGMSPRIFLGLSTLLPLGVFVLFGYSRLALNMLRGIGSEGYFKSESGVYYDGSALDGADPGSFERLGDAYSGYARDRAHLYYRGKTVRGADAASFAPVLAGTASTAYWRDAAHIYREGEVIDGANSASFIALHVYGYAHDAKRVFYQGKVIAGADAGTLRVIGDNVAVDKARIYFLGGAILPNADAASFELFEDNSYGRDANKIYALPNSLFAEAHEIAGADRATFKPLDRAYAKDAHRVYAAERSGAVVMEGADAASFEVTQWDEATQSEARDKLHHYVNGKVVDQPAAH